MLGVGAGELLVLLVLGLLVVGPERLPRFAADVARFLRTVRRMMDDAREEVRATLEPELRELAGEGRSGSPRYDDAT